MVSSLKRYFLLYRMQLRNFSKNIIQFLAVILISTLAITFYIGLMANADSISDRFNKTMELGNVADIYITTADHDSNDYDLIKDCLSSEDEIEGRIYLPGYIGSRESYVIITEGNPTISSFYDINNDGYVSEDGFVYLDEMLLSFNHKDSVHNGLHVVGDNVFFYFSLAQLGIEDKADILSSPELLNDGKTGLVSDGSLAVNMTITGGMHHPENILGANYNRSVSCISYSKFRKALIKTIDEQYNDTGKATIRNTLVSAFGFDIYTEEHLTCFNQYLVKAKDKKSITATKEKIDISFENKGRNPTIVDLTDMPFYSVVANDVKQARTFTFVFPLFFFIVAALIVMTTITQLIIKDRMQIGTLKAIGFKKREILFNYISLMSGLSFIGIILGSIIGPIIIPLVMDKKYSTLYDIVDRQYVFPWLSAILIIIAFLGLTILVTFLGSYGEIKLPPSESMKPKVPKLSTFINDKKKTGSITLSIRMAIRNIRCDLTRSIMVIVGVLGCTCLLLCGFGMEDTIYHGIENDQQIFLVGDIKADLSGNYSKEKLLEQTSKFDEIEDVEVYKTVTLTFTNEDKTLANDNDIYVLSEEDSIFGLDVPDDGALVCKSIADSLKLKKGDDIYFTYGGQSGSIKIADIFESFYYNCIVVSPNASIVNEYNFLSNGYNHAWLSIKDGTILRNFTWKLIRNSSAITGAIMTTQLYRYIKNTISAFLTITTTVKIFGIFLALLTLFNLALLNMNQRRRDIATMKILGFRKREIALSLLIESMSLSTIGIMIGMALGYPFMIFVLESNKVNIINYLYTIKPASYIYTLILTFFVAFLINLIFALRTKKINMAEITRSRY